MIERSEELCFPLNPGNTAGILCELLWQDFDGDIPTEL
jgi:hypothetical protein